MPRPILIVPEVLVAAPAVALVCAFPGAVRLSGANMEFFEAWLAVAGLLCPIVAFGLAAVRLGRRSAVTLALPLGGWLLGLALWVLISLPVVAVWGAVLKTHTHHRGLAGATFAVGTLAIYAATALVAWRARAIVAVRFADSTRKPSALLAGAALALVVATAAAGALAGDSASSEVTSRIPALLVDGTLTLVGLALGAMLDLSPQRARDAGWLGGGTLVFVFSVGLALAARSGSFERAVASGAPLAGVTADALGMSDGAPESRSSLPEK